MPSSTCSGSRPRCCRASCRSATSTRTSSSSPTWRPGSPPRDALDLPPALGGLERRFLLARLVYAWAERLEPRPGEPPLIVRHPAAALALADDLARLMDDMITREVPWQRLDKPGAGPSRRILAAHPAVPADRQRGVAGDPRRARRHRAGGAARPPDRRRSAPSRRVAGRARHRGRLDRLDAGHRAPARDHRAAIPAARWCCRASTPRSTTPRGTLIGGAEDGPSARSPAIRNSPCTASWRASASPAAR